MCTFLSEVITIDSIGLLKFVFLIASACALLVAGQSGRAHGLRNDDHTRRILLLVSVQKRDDTQHTYTKNQSIEHRRQRLSNRAYVVCALAPSSVLKKYL